MYFRWNTIVDTVTSTRNVNQYWLNLSIRNNFFLQPKDWICCKRFSWYWLATDKMILEYNWSEHRQTFFSTSISSCVNEGLVCLFACKPEWNHIRLCALYQENKMFNSLTAAGGVCYSANIEPVNELVYNSRHSYEVTRSRNFKRKS